MPSSSRSGARTGADQLGHVVSVPCRTLGESAVRRDTPSVIGRSSSNRTLHTMHSLGITVWATVWVAVDEMPLSGLTRPDNRWNLSGELPRMGDIRAPS